MFLLPAQTFSTLVTFDGTDGLGPDAALLQATNGDLYETTNSGGANGIQREIIGKSFGL